MDRQRGCGRKMRPSISFFVMLANPTIFYAVMMLFARHILDALTGAGQNWDRMLTCRAIWRKGGRTEATAAVNTTK